jgi:methionyl-tRNA synthetase
MANKFYITTTLPYVNAPPHQGFALEIIQADVIARFKTLQGYNVFFNTGTDEHGQKIYQKAVEEGKDPQAYTDEYAAKFDILKEKLNLTYNNFTRTTDNHHRKAAQELWNICLKNGYIEKGNYNAKYCIGCELEKQDSDLVDDKCPDHPSLNLSLIKEENYFFKFSKLQNKLLKLYKDNPNFVIPSHRQTEIENFVRSGLKDFSVSRLKEKMPWGVPVPNDDKHVMFVWFDALTNYISALGWPEDTKKFEEFWGTNKKPNALQVAGKDNLRQQTSMWQAMLIAADLPVSKQIFIHGFIIADGQKMSKTLGNVVDPIEYVNKYGTDPLRYYLLAKVSPTEDSDFTKQKFEDVYNADLANGLGNLVSRVAKMCEESKFIFKSKETNLYPEVIKALEEFRFDNALKFIWDKVTLVDQEINKTEPWKLEGDNLKKALQNYLNQIAEIALNLKPFLPETTEKIAKIFGGVHIKMAKPLFPRI